jgi:hypothetical protein
MQVTKSKGTGSKSLYVGIFSAKVIAINPTTEEISALFGKEADPEKEETKYEGTSTTGTNDEYVVIAPWVEVTSTEEHQKFKIPFYLVDKPMVWPKSGKLQFVSSTGDNGSADSAANLQDWFTHYQDFKTKENTADKVVRQAIEGEANWYQFLKPWLSKVKFSDPATNILFDSKKLFRNVDKYVNDEYRALLKMDSEETLIGEIVGLAYVVTKEKDGVISHQQKFWGTFLGPQVKDGSRWIATMNAVNTAMSTGNWKTLDKWHKGITDLEHGCKGHYKLELLQPFVEGEYQAAGNTSFIPASEDGTPAPVVDTTY